MEDSINHLRHEGHWPIRHIDMRLTFSPKTTGAKSGTFTIQDSASSKPQVINLSGTGT